MALAVTDALIHEFDAKQTPCFDDDGDQMIGFYFQFIDGLSRPIGGLIGPYKYKLACEKAAQRAFEARDF